MEASPPAVSVPGSLPTADVYSPYLGQGQVGALTCETRRVPRKQPIGFIHFPSRTEK